MTNEDERTNDRERSSKNRKGTEVENGDDDFALCAKKAKERVVLDGHGIRKVHLSSYAETMINMIKGSIGCGVLGMGITFKYGGLITTSLMIFLGAFQILYNQHVLIDMANTFREKYKMSVISYSDTIALAFENGPSFTQKLATTMRRTINFCIILNQFAMCCLYFLFVWTSFEQVLGSFSPDVSQYKFATMLIVFTIIWATSMIRQFKYLVPMSLLANLSLFAVYGVILYHTTSDLEPLSERTLFGDWERLPLCFGNVVYAVEGVTLTLPLQQQMKNKRLFTNSYGVLNVTAFISMMLIEVMGFFGYWKFGEDVGGSLTTNLTLEENVLSRFIIMFMIIGILFTYTLQFLVLISIIMPSTETSWCPFAGYYLWEYVFRTLLVLLTFLVAAIIPHFELFMALTGVLCSLPLSFLFVPVGHLAVAKSDHFKLPIWKIVLDIISIVIGFIGLGCGIISCVKEMVSRSRF